MLQSRKHESATASMLQYVRQGRNMDLCFLGKLLADRFETKRVFV